MPFLPLGRLGLFVDELLLELSAGDGGIELFVDEILIDYAAADGCPAIDALVTAAMVEESALAN